VGVLVAVGVRVGVIPVGTIVTGRGVGVIEGVNVIEGVSVVVLMKVGCGVGGWVMMVVPLPAPQSKVNWLLAKSLGCIPTDPSEPGKPSKSRNRDAEVCASTL
jgi:hypothetical protein